MKESAERHKVLVTGGLGYVGSHCVLELVKQGYNVVIVDSLQNSNAAVFDRLLDLLNLTHVTDRISLFESNLLDVNALEVVFAECHPIEIVMHLAGFKSVGESILKPIAYYENNLVSTINLLKCMSKFNVSKLIFSSSATVYGIPESLPLKEDHPIGRNLTNTYGADPSGKIGESPHGPPANLMPFVSQVAVGARTCVNVFGNDYETHDGTGIRDYLHVTDLAIGHVDAIRKMSGGPIIEVFNLGTGSGVSVLQVIKAMERASGKKIPYQIKPRREGDIATVYCDPSKAERELGWKARRTLEDMCEDQWRWQSMNPDGYEKK